jgi:MFS family permease
LTSSRLGRSYLQLWLASTGAYLGNGVMLAAAPLLAASLTQDARLVAGLTVSLTLPYVLFGLPGGVLVDWFDRRRLMYAVNLVRGVVTAGAAGLAFLGHANIFLLYGLFFVIGTGETIFRNAAQSIVPSLVPNRSLARANGGLLMGEIMGTEFVGPPLGGFLFGAGITVPLALNAATYGLGATLLMAMPMPSARGSSEARRRAFLPAIAEGMSWLAREPLLRALAVVTGAINLTASAVIAIMVLYARQRLHLGGAGYGLLLSCGAAGSIAGSIVAPWAARLLGPGRTLVCALVLLAISPAVIAATSSRIVAGAMLMLAGVGNLSWTVVATSLRQAMIPDHLLGRVGSVYRLIAWGSLPLGALAAGFLAHAEGIQAPFWASAVMISLLTLVVFRLASSGAIERARVSVA